MIDPTAATEKLVAQFERPTELLDTLEAKLGSKQAAIAGITGLVASSFAERDFVYSIGARAQMLSDWHNHLRSTCSDEYAELRAKNFSREEANDTERLMVLNGIRIGVRAAMNNDYRLSAGQRDQITDAA
jgi:hypothetical protein